MIDTFTHNENSRAIAQNTLINLIIEYFKKNIYSSLSLNDICTQFLICKTQLYDLFNKNLGTSPIDYFNALKIKESKKLLREEFSVNYIADKMGYLNIHSFSRAFKNQTGFSPTEYRKSINN